MDALGNHLACHNINNSELLDFIDDANFDQFIDLIRGGEGEHPIANFDCELMINGSLDDYNLFGPASTTPPGPMFGFNDAFLPDPSTFVLTTLPNCDEEMKDEEDYNDGEDSSGTTNTNTTTTTTKRQKVDRSRTLVSERKRRGRMKERLYALRSLVPNITKMDKASIVGDAVLYVQDLQMHAKKLNAEIASLEASLAGADEHMGYLQGSTKTKNKKKVSDNNHLVSKGIIQIDVSQVEEKGFYVKVACNKGQGVATALYKALESLACFNVQSSNLNTILADRFELAFTLNLKDCEQGIINSPNLKHWVAGAFLNQGFVI
ncbi:transcription factor FER-LIKE IRON DEFICIENCY-INDUCED TRANSCRIPTION FACTOR-like [Pyrus x bretschneideri]|uniref:transcription factor FER-LIKE IRON DEFICIENCY-INDUCED TRANSCRIPTION FACTOR-like n=1 Tax=Pyrus x bretschneideri TaxID=225117 RepID=UPI00202E8A25|nr:transcription factor FER-LIKE IRON DEFICIENCY-INDUCED TRANSCRIPTION FACTOR-like [Pyrus x bretschneideri]